MVLPGKRSNAPEARNDILLASRILKELLSPLYQQHHVRPIGNAIWIK